MQCDFLRCRSNPSYFPLLCQEGSGSHLAWFLPPWRLSRAAGTYAGALQKSPLAETSRRRDRAGATFQHGKAWSFLWGGIFSEIMYTQHDSSNKFGICVALGSSTVLIALWDLTYTLTYVYAYNGIQHIRSVPVVPHKAVAEVSRIGNV